MRTALALDASFIGFGRSGTDDNGIYWFETIRPGPVPFDAGRMQAPHISVMVCARGLLNHLATRLYFADEPTNEADPLLQLVPAERRGTLLARREPAAAGEATGEHVVYRFNFVLQGAGETVFFNL